MSVDERIARAQRARVRVLGSLLLTTACGPEGVSSGSEGISETEALACEWPLGSAPDAGIEHVITFVNNTNEPRFLIPVPAAPTLLRFVNPVGGELLFDDSQTPCSELMHAPDHDSCTNPPAAAAVVDAIRLEPGASYARPWDGHLWRQAWPDDACLESIGACFDACDSGVMPASSVVLELLLRSAQCSPDALDACSCAPVDGVCVIEAPYDLEAMFDTDVVDVARFVIVGSSSIEVPLMP